MSGPRTSEQERVPPGPGTQGLQLGAGRPQARPAGPHSAQGPPSAQGCVPGTPASPWTDLQGVLYPAPRTQPKARSRDPRPRGHVSQADPTAALRTSEAAAPYPAHVSDQKLSAAGWVKELAPRPPAPSGAAHRSLTLPPTRDKSSQLGWRSWVKTGHHLRRPPALQGRQGKVQKPAGSMLRGSGERRLGLSQ